MTIPADAITTDSDGLLDFAQKLEDMAAQLEAGATDKIAAVTTALEKAARSYTKDSKTAPVFAPLGASMGTAMDKVSSNVTALITTLRNDARLLRDLVDTVDAHESNAAQGFDNINPATRTV